MVQAVLIRAYQALEPRWIVRGWPYLSLRGTYTHNTPPPHPRHDQTNRLTVDRNPSVIYCIQIPVVHFLWVNVFAAWKLDVLAWSLENVNVWPLFHDIVWHVEGLQAVLCLNQVDNLSTSLYLSINWIFKLDLFQFRSKNAKDIHGQNMSNKSTLICQGKSSSSQIVPTLTREGRLIERMLRKENSLHEKSC